MTNDTTKQTWRRVTDDPPPEGELVETKFVQGDYVERMQLLKIEKGKWRLPDGSYLLLKEPTHWKERD